MEWDRYAANFRAAAFDRGFDEGYVRRCLDYAARIHASGIVIIYDLEHLARLVGYDLGYVLGAAYDSSSFYRAFTVAKKAGGEREIREPLPSLKEIHRWLLDHTLNRLS